MGARSLAPLSPQAIAFMMLPPSLLVFPLPASVVALTICDLRGMRKGPFHFGVASTWAPNCPQRGPYTGRGARTGGLVDDRTPKAVTSSRDFMPGLSTHVQSSILTFQNRLITIPRCTP